MLWCFVAVLTLLTRLKGSGGLCVRADGSCTGTLKQYSHPDELIIRIPRGGFPNAEFTSDQLAQGGVDYAVKEDSPLAGFNAHLYVRLAAASAVAWVRCSRLPRCTRRRESNVLAIGDQAIGDLNGDSFPDVVAWILTFDVETHETAHAELAYFASDGDGSYSRPDSDPVAAAAAELVKSLIAKQLPSPYPVPASELVSPVTPVLHDIDSDGDLDLIVTGTVYLHQDSTSEKPVNVLYFRNFAAEDESREGAPGNVRFEHVPHADSPFAYIGNGASSFFLQLNFADFTMDGEPALSPPPHNLHAPHPCRECRTPRTN